MKTVPEKRISVARGRTSSKHSSDLRYVCNPKQLAVDISINSSPNTQKQDNHKGQLFSRRFTDGKVNLPEQNHGF